MKQWLSSNAKIIKAFLENLDTPIALSVWIAYENKEWDRLALQQVEPRHYPEGIFSALRFKKDLQAVDLLRKAPLPTKINRKKACLQAWEDAETQCYQSNEFILSLFPVGGSKDPLKRDLAEFLGLVKKRMARWLGKLPDDLSGGFGPGTCAEYQGRDPTVVDKLWLLPTTTPSAAHLFRWCYDRTHWGRSRWNCQLGPPGVSPGNRFTTVPKDGKTDRPISIEPLGNLWLQLGIGSYLKTRLKKIGLPAYKPASREIFPTYFVSEQDAQSVHSSLARRAWKENLATIDLSSASDTICIELVRAILPQDWFELLDDARSKHTLVPSKDGQKRYRLLEKFSSMGNGFTFELESLIFSALLSVCCDLTPGENLWVFGDDIVLPNSCFDVACSCLRVFGFTPNGRKSFGSGPFYESCGGNFHSGIDVTPIRIKEPLDSPTEWYAFHNACYRLGMSRKVLRLIRNNIPRQLQFTGPERLGDVVLHGLPFKTISKDGWKRVLSLRAFPRDPIPLERWSPELAMSALLLGSSTRVTRRNSTLLYGSVEASVS